VNFTLQWAGVFALHPLLISLLNLLQYLVNFTLHLINLQDNSCKIKEKKNRESIMLLGMILFHLY